MREWEHSAGASATGDACQQDANDYPDGTNSNPSTVSKCCNDLAQAVAPIQHAEDPQLR